MLAIVVALIAPMPSFLLDLLIVGDIMMSVIVLMVAMYITKPVDFNVFPTTLLISLVILVGLGVAIFMFYRSGVRGTGEAPVPAADTANPKYGTWGFDTSGMDTAIKPGDDFFGYANGKWAARTEIPSDRVRFGNFDKLSVLSENRAHAIDIEAAAGKLSDKDGAKIGAAYASFMNEGLADKLGAKPIQPELGQIRAVKTKDQFTGLMAKANSTGFATVFPIGIGIDAKSPKKYAVHAANGGLGLPDRDYYLQASFAEKKAAYQAYVEKLLILEGWPDAAGKAAAIVALETKIAAAHWDVVKRRDADLTYNLRTFDQLVSEATGFDWAVWLHGLGASAEQAAEVVVSQPDALTAFAALWESEDLEDWKRWLRWRVISGEIDIYTAPALRREIADAIDAGSRRFVLDLTETSFLDSTALGVIIGVSKRVRPLGGDLAIVNVTPSIAKTLEITGLAELFPISETRDEAVAALGSDCSGAGIINGASVVLVSFSVLVLPD